MPTSLLIGRSIKRCVNILKIFVQSSHDIISSPITGAQWRTYPLSDFIMQVNLFSNEIGLKPKRIYVYEEYVVGILFVIAILIKKYS